MLLALIQNNVVCGIYQPTNEADANSIARVVQIAIDITDYEPQPQIGWPFNGSVIVQPDGTPGINWKITKLAIRERLTSAELMGIEAASVGTSTLALAVQAIMGNLNVATYVDLSRPDTATAINTLVAFGLLTSARATAILTTQPGAIELWGG